MARRPQRACSLTDADLAAIKEKIDEALGEALPKAFLSIGIKADTPDDIIRAQRAFSFLFKLSKAADEAQSVVWKRILNTIVVVLGLMLAAGAGVIMSGRPAVPPAHIGGQ